MTAKIISIKNNPATFYLLLSGIVFSAIFYIYCVNSAVRNVVARERAEREIQALQTVTSELEYRYINDENSMTLERARALGLLEPAGKIFISRNSERNPLSLGNNR